MLPSEQRGPERPLTPFPRALRKPLRPCTFCHRAPAPGLPRTLQGACSREGSPAGSTPCKAMARPEHASRRAESWRACWAGSCSPELQRSRSLHPGNTVLRWRPGMSVERRDQGRGRGGERGGGTWGRGQVRRGVRKNTQKS